MTDTILVTRPPSVEEIVDTAAYFNIEATFVEKDWYAIQALRIVSVHAFPGVLPVFSGGTSLSKGYGLIQRFSEDIDFKLATPEPITRNQRRDFRNAIVAAFDGYEGFSVDAASVSARDESRQFSLNIQYPQSIPQHDALRPFIKLEMRFQTPFLPTNNQPLHSFHGKLKGGEPEAYIQCVNPVETASEKLSALIWRVITKDRGEPVGSIKNEPEMVRHLHDLAALEPLIRGNEDFVRLVRANYEHDKKRGGLAGNYLLIDAAQAAQTMLVEDKLYEKEYVDFVLNLSYARTADRLSFLQAMDPLEKLISLLVKPSV